MDNLKSELPYGKPFLIGDSALWEAILNKAKETGVYGDALKEYADIRGITRAQAKQETFTIRYGWV